MGLTRHSAHTPVCLISAFNLYPAVGFLLPLLYTVPHTVKMHLLDLYLCVPVPAPLLLDERLLRHFWCLVFLICGVHSCFDNNAT
ncbi:hypothetical protein CBOM_07067 [Ceraceosorus bombacis]|uniref:Uncharacterized protein n=1 Tax=Ceraceosorus bombacis TaxID=401625 RepID=A0A0P1B859_9BASI|nr:hypothetical protein CBOM_07067 [Ceraceosorus bombacis]